MKREEGRGRATSDGNNKERKGITDDLSFLCSHMRLTFNIATLISLALYILSIFAPFSTRCE